MEATPKMQAFITSVMKKHENDFTQGPVRRLRLELEHDHLWPLRLMVTDTVVSVEGPPFSKCSSRPSAGFLIAAGPWYPFWTIRAGRLSRFYAVRDRSQGKDWGHFIPVPEAKEEQAREAFLCEIWAQELEEQGWLTDAHVVKETAA